MIFNCFFVSSCAIFSRGKANSYENNFMMKSDKHLSRIPLICCGLTIGLGAIALTGWLSGLRLLASIGYHYIPMAPNTAVAFIALGIVVFALHFLSRYRAFRWLSAFLAACITAMGVLTLTRYFQFTVFDIDQAFLNYSGEVLLGKFSVSMSPLTAGSFILSGVSLFVLTLPSYGKPVRNVASCLATIAASVGCIVTVGYLCRSPILYGGNTTPMALNTACAFVCTGVSLILLAGLECIPASYFTGVSARARLMRGFFPVPILTIIFTGFILDTFIIKGSFSPVVAIGVNTVISGGIIGFIVFLISKKIGGSIDRAEAMRKQTNEKLRKITESAFDAIVMIDENGRINYWNSAAEAMFGYTKGEAMGKDVHTLLLPEGYSESYRNGMKTFKANGTGPILGKRMVLPARRKDGAQFYAEHSFATFQSDNGWNAVSVIRDCTEQRRYEDALKKLNETLEQRVATRTEELLEKNNELIKLTQAIEQSPACVMITDTNGNIEYVNPRFVELTRYSLNEVKGQNPRVLKSGKTPPERHKDLWDTITSGRTWQGEFINQKKNGALYREFASISPLKNSEGKITQYLAFKSDITEIRTLEEEQQRLKEQLYHAQKLESVGSLAGGIAHDFNNMLMAIMGYTELAEDEIAEDNPARIYLKKVLASSKKATELTQSLLAFSRRQPVSLSPVLLNGIINNIKRLLLKTVRENIHCTFNLSDKDIKVLADSDKMEQVVVNLANNAVDAMPDGGSLTISTEVVVLDGKSANKYGLDKGGAYGVLTISDTGMGMDEETKDRIFEPFFTTKERGKGTGLGLPIVYGIVKQHHGHIAVISEPGNGATFHIYLPATEKESARVDAKTETHAMPPAEPKTILVAEDDEDVRALIIRILEGSGYYVISATNGEDAVKKFEGHKDKIDMLLFDVMMPKKGGKEAYNSIRKLRPDIKILFMSGYSENIITNKEIREEGLAFVQKPVNSDRLLKKIKETLVA